MASDGTRGAGQAAGGPPDHSNPDESPAKRAEESARSPPENGKAPDTRSRAWKPKWLSQNKERPNCW